jgi:hypothetical protein
VATAAVGDVETSVMTAVAVVRMTAVMVAAAAMEDVDTSAATVVVQGRMTDAVLIAMKDVDGSGAHRNNDQGRWRK